MKVRRVLLTSKTTLFEMQGLARRDPRLAAMLQLRDPLVAHVESSHIETVHARQVVREALQAMGAEVTESRRLGRIANGRFDMVVSVGGDGTVLDVARFVDHTPILAVNSSPSTSFGHFTCVTADGFEDMLRRVCSGLILPVELARLRLSVDGRRHLQPILNDVLIADRVPSSTSRYILQVGEDSEEQKSSGIWISTAAGSTGAMGSAKGIPMDIHDRRLQYKVREPCLLGPPARDWKLLGGIVDGPVTLVSRMIRGGAFLDGRRVAMPLGFGGKVEIRPDGPGLRLFLRGGD